MSRDIYAGTEIGRKKNGKIPQLQLVLSVFKNVFKIISQENKIYQFVNTTIVYFNF